MNSLTLTWSSIFMGIALTIATLRLYSLNTKTISKFFRWNWTRSKWTSSTSSKVMTNGGHSVRLTRQPEVGCRLTVDRNGAPGNPNSLKGVSNSISCLVMLSTCKDKKKSVVSTQINSLFQNKLVRASHNFS